MPYRQQKLCAVSNCPNRAEPHRQYCAVHMKMFPECRSAAFRGYGKRWQRESKQYLASHPLCEECLKHGVYTKATVVDHIVPHRGDQKLFWDRSNWQALCKPCHDKKTGNEDSHPVYHF